MLHPRFIDAVRHLHPNVAVPYDCPVQAGPDGLELIAWNLPGDPPTDAEVEALIPTLDAPPVPPVPATISDRQFGHGLAKQGVITKPEALAFVKTGTVPPALEAILAGIPDADQRFDAEMLLSGATIFERQHPFTEAIAAAYGWTPVETDAFWTYCASL